MALPPVPLISLWRLVWRSSRIRATEAFLKPTRQGYEQTVMDDSVAKLADYMARVGRVYGLSADHRALTAVQDYTLPGAEVQPSLDDLLQWLAKELPEG